MYLFDTNHCSRMIFGDPTLIQQLQLHSEADVTTSVIVLGELFYMVAKSERTAANMQQVRAFLNIKGKKCFCYDEVRRSLVWWPT